MIARRALLKGSGLALLAFGTGAVPSFLSRASQAATEPGASRRHKTLVIVFQRGGMDGLMAVSPFADPGLARLRPRLMLPAPGSGKEHALLELDGRFGLHPALASFAPLFHDGRLAIVHGAGSVDATRSHLDATHAWESGMPGDRGLADGWLNRALGAAAIGRDMPVRAVTMTRARSRATYGDESVLAISSADELLVAEPGARNEAVRGLYAASTNDLLARTAASSVEAAKLLKMSPATEGKQDYPAGSVLGGSLREIARLIKANVGLQVAFAESVGDATGTVSWDSHSNERRFPGPFATIAEDFSRSIVAFWNDLGELQDDVVLATMTDFGRNVAENATAGTDHGRGTCIFVLGNSIAGGRVYGTLPERFEPDALEDQADLPVTTDYRAVMASLLVQQLGVRDMGEVFPTWSGEPAAIVKV
jgi:uncharacterized protein (DUF1501 family)